MVNPWNKSARAVLRRLGIYASKLRNAPFGVDWLSDVRFMCGDFSMATVFDVGANQGQTALKLANEFPRARVHSFEPVPATYAMLEKAVRALDTVVPVNSAIGDTIGQIEMTGEPGSGTNTVVSSGEIDNPIITVPVTTLDAYCRDNRFDSVDLLKIDTEGAELSVLRGSKSLISEGKIRAIVAECEFAHRPGQPHGSFFDIWKFLDPFGYRVCAFYSGGADRHGWVWGDCLFIHPALCNPPVDYVVCSPYLSGCLPTRE